MSEDRAPQSAKTPNWSLQKATCGQRRPLLSKSVQTVSLCAQSLIPNPSPLP